MTETHVSSRVAELIESFERRARANGRTFEQEAEWVIARGEKFTPEERVAVSRYFRRNQPENQTPLTLDEIRDGLM